MFQLDQNALLSRQTILPGSLGQELSLPHHVRVVTKVLMNHTSDNGIVNRQFPGDCPHGFPSILIDGSLDTNTEMTNSGVLRMSEQR